MENDVFKTNPVFQNLSPEKLSFLMNFANSKKPTEMKDMMPFLLGTLSSAKKQNIQFTKPETELMISILKQSMSPEEAEKADQTEPTQLHPAHERKKRTVSIEAARFFLIHFMMHVSIWQFLTR